MRASLLGVVLVGIDEETAIVSDDATFGRWVVHGRRSAWLYASDGPASYSAGNAFVI